MKPPDALVQLLQPWNDFYSHSKTTETIVLFLHIGGLLLAGGFAIAADRTTLRALRGAASNRPQYLAEQMTVHKWVISGLGIIVVSGLALLTSDIETFWGSWIYWGKMALVVLLLINGLMMTRTEKTLTADTSGQSPGWDSLRRTAVTSLMLWFAIALAGVALANFS